MYDDNYPQYPMYFGPRPRREFDPKYLNDALMQLLFQTQTKQQMLDAFTPGYTGGSGAPNGLTTNSYLDQLLAQTQAQAPAAAPVAQAAAPLQQLLEEEGRKRKIMMDGGGKIDRGGYGGLGMAGY